MSVTGILGIIALVTAVIITAVTLARGKFIVVPLMWFRLPAPKEPSDKIAPTWLCNLVLGLILLGLVLLFVQV